MMSVSESPLVRASLASVELPLLTLQLLTQLQYDRDVVKRHYESCKQELNLQKQKTVKETVRWQQTVEELQSDVTNLSIKASSALEEKMDLELQLEVTGNQLKTAEGRLNELESLLEYKDQMLEKQNQEISDRVSQIWAGIQRVELSSKRSSDMLLQTKQNLTGMLHGEEFKAEDIEKVLTHVQELVEVMHNNTQVYQQRNTAEERVQQLLGRIKSLEEKLEQRSRMIKSFWKHLSNLSLIRDTVLKDHSALTAIVEHHKSKIVRTEAELPRLFQNFTTAYQKYMEQTLQERLTKLLNGKYKEDVLLDVAKSGKVEDISLLIHFDVDTEARDSNGKTALHLATENGHLQACVVLLDAGARIEAVATGFEGNTPIYLAAWKGHLDIVRLFAERGAKLSRKNRNGATPLKVAKVWNHHHVAKFLEEQGATE